MTPNYCPVCPVQQAVWGFTRVLQAEQPTSECRLVDLCPNETDVLQLAASVAAELRLPWTSGAAECAYRMRVRLVPTLKASCFPECGTLPAPTMTPAPTMMFICDTHDCGIELSCRREPGVIKLYSATQTLVHFTPSLQFFHVPQPLEVKPGNGGFHSKATYVITGGTGGLGTCKIHTSALTPFTSPHVQMFKQPQV